MSFKKTIGKEVRYAIIIGINDYEIDPLKYCVNDAKEIQKALIDNCNFKKEDTFLITSESENSTKDIMGKYFSAIESIKERFVKNQDSILFYFAGHGSFEQNKSMLHCQDTKYPIKSIFENITLIEPKRHFYIIDACHSGGNVLIRSNDNIIKKYIECSKGTVFLYACSDSKCALETSALQHGLFTSNLLKAINDKKNYDEEGCLSFNKIIDIVNKSTMNGSDFYQIPVMENKLEGFYPFGIINIQKDTVEINLNKINFDCVENENLSRDSLSLKDIRTEIMDALANVSEKQLKDFNNKDIYKNTYYNNFDDFIYDNIDFLKKEIVTYVENSKLIPLPNLIYLEIKERNFSNQFFGQALKTVALLQNQPLELEIYNINFENTNLKSKFKTCMSNSLNHVSFSTGYIIYQAKWGIVLLKISFLIDWNGENYNEIKNLEIDHFAFPLKIESIDKINNLKDIFLNFNYNLLDSWNYDRQEELSVYEF